MRKPVRTRFSAVFAALALTFGAGLVATGVTAGASAESARVAQTYLVPTGGQTMLRLDPDTAQVLADNDVEIAPASEARTGSSGLVFPVTGGLINAKSLQGSFKHSGGLTFTAGGKSLTIRNFVVSTTSGTLTAYADEARASVPVLRLDLAKATIKASTNKLAVYALPATLTPQAASTLNEYFATDIFAGGLSIGTVRADVAIRQLRG